MSDDRYEYLRKQLETQMSFPSKYMFKFIVPKDKVDQIKPHFETAEITEKHSTKGNYVSVTVLVIVFSAEDVLHGYKRVSHIEGLVAL
jgi:putative lipoic acid-binding regulatory protein